MNHQIDKIAKWYIYKKNKRYLSYFEMPPEDMVQETALVMLKRLKTYDPNKGLLIPYLIRNLDIQIKRLICSKINIIKWPINLSAALYYKNKTNTLNTIKKYQPGHRLCEYLLETDIAIKKEDNNDPTNVYQHIVDAIEKIKNKQLKKIATLKLLEHEPYDQIARQYKHTRQWAEQKFINALREMLKHLTPEQKQEIREYIGNKRWNMFINKLDKRRKKSKRKTT